MSLEDTLSGARTTFQDFENYVQGSTKSYATMVCKRYLERLPESQESAIELVNMYIKKVTRYESILRTHQSEVLNLAGMGDEYYEINKLIRSVL
jgi:hypothetical protein